MASTIVLDNGFTRTGMVAATIPATVYDYSGAFAIKSNKPGEQILTAKNAANDQPFTIRVAVQDIKDIYRNTPISPAFKSANPTGKAILVQSFQVIRKYLKDGSTIVDPTYRIDLPHGARIVMDLPNDGDYTDAMAAQLLADTAGAILDYLGVVRIGDLRKGALTPRDL